MRRRGKVDRSKYGAVATELDGIRFASKKEAHRYGELKLLERAKQIYGLELQPHYELNVGVRGPYERVKIGDYVADFRYREGPQGILRIEDVKGFKTPLYRWKKKHVEAQYGIRIIEI